MAIPKYFRMLNSLFDIYYSDSLVVIYANPILDYSHIPQPHIRFPTVIKVQ